MMSNMNNKELAEKYERINPNNCSHGYGGWCGTCKYAVEPIDLDLCEDYPTYCLRSPKESE